MKKSIKNDCEEIIRILHKFSQEIVMFGNSIKDNRIEKFENKIGYKIPSDFKYILSIYNGIELMGTEILKFNDKEENSIERVYKFEHSIAQNKMFPNLVPFSPDGYGNHYCMDLRYSNTDYCPIVFWQWDIEYKTINEVEVCNVNFLEWIKEVMIEWTLEDYNYDGSEKE